MPAIVNIGCWHDYYTANTVFTSDFNHATVNSLLLAIFQIANKFACNNDYIVENHIFLHDCFLLKIDAIQNG